MEINPKTNLLYIRALLDLFLNHRKFIKENPKKIVVIQTMKMGDMVCTTPLFNAIKKHLPNTQLIVLGDKINEELLLGHTSIDRYIVYKEHDASKIIKILKEEDIDVGITPGPNPIGLAVLALSGAKTIIVPKIENDWSPYETKWYKILRKFVVTIPHRMRHYAPREYLNLLTPLGINEKDTTKTLEINKEVLDKGIITLPTSLLVGIAPSAGNKIKSWPPDRFAQIADFVIEKYKAHILILGGPKDSEEVKAMLSFVANTNHVTDLSNKLKIEELKATISKLDLFIASDTGSIYIAEAFDVPTIDIVGPVDENVQPPKYGNHVVIVPDRKGKEAPITIMNSRVYDKGEVQNQTTATPVSDVVSAINTILKKHE